MSSLPGPRPGDPEAPGSRPQFPHLLLEGDSAGPGTARRLGTCRHHDLGWWTGPSSLLSFAVPGWARGSPDTARGRCPHALPRPYVSPWCVAPGARPLPPSPTAARPTGSHPLPAYLGKLRHGGAASPEPRAFSRRRATSGCLTVVPECPPPPSSSATSVFFASGCCRSGKRGAPPRTCREEGLLETSQPAPTPTPPPRSFLWLPKEEAQRPQHHKTGWARGLPVGCALGLPESPPPPQLSWGRPPGRSLSLCPTFFCQVETAWAVGSRRIWGNGCRAGVRAPTSPTSRCVSPAVTTCSSCF